jgi:uncharacterized membrane protein YkvA (DUF1232 family)
MTEQGPSLPKQLLAKPAVQMLLFLITIAYVISPADFIPDVPIIGWIDDAAVVLAQLASFIVYLKEKRRQYTEKKQKQSEGN